MIIRADDYPCNARSRRSNMHNCRMRDASPLPLRADSDDLLVLLTVSHAGRFVLAPDHLELDHSGHPPNGGRRFQPIFRCAPHRKNIQVLPNCRPSRRHRRLRPVPELCPPASNLDRRHCASPNPSCTSSNPSHSIPSSFTPCCQLLRAVNYSVLSITPCYQFESDLA